MAYPPSVPSGARINTTPAVDQHPADHLSIHAALTDIINILGADPAQGEASLTALLALTNSVPVGCPIEFAGPDAPTGWALCDGAAVSRATYPLLFAAIGTTWGVGDGTTTFNLPDKSDRFSVGKGGAPFATLGAVGGSKDAIAVDHLHAMAHEHGFSATSAESTHGHFFTTRRDTTASGSSGHPMLSNASGVNVTKATAGDTHSHAVSGATGASSAANTSHAGASGVDKNLPPYVVMNYIIRLA